MSSPYIRLKVLIAPASASPSASGSSTSPPAPASHSYLLRRVEVSRSMPFRALADKLQTLYATGPDARWQIALDESAGALGDADVCSSDRVSGLVWESVGSDADWARLVQGRARALVRVTPRPHQQGQPKPKPQQPPQPYRMQPVMPRKSPAPWPKFAPDLATLPIVVLESEEHEWEVLEEEDFERMRVEEEGECKKEEGEAVAKKKIAPAAAAGSHVPHGTVKKPNRTLPAELVAKLTGQPVSQDPTPTSSVTFAVNGSMYVLPNPSPQLKLIDFLRYEAGITGSKIGCGEGGCGACTVVLSCQDATTGQTIQYSTKACLHPVAAMNGWAVTTTEGLGSEQTGLHPIQQQVVNKWATQCGYCTPGFVMSMYGLLANNPSPSAAQIEDQFDGNLCRCTGYRPIFAAMRAVVPGVVEQARQQGGCGCGGKEGGGCGCSSGQEGGGGCASSPGDVSTLKACGKGTGASCTSAAKSACHRVGVKCGVSTDLEDLCGSGGPKYDPRNPKHNVNPFPPALVEFNHARRAAGRREPGGAVRFLSDAASIWIEPQSLADVSSMLGYYTAQGEVVKLVVGNTSVGVEKYYPLNPSADHPTVFVDLAALPDLRNVGVTPGVSLDVGAAVTLTTLISTMQATIDAGPAATYASWVPVVRHLRMVANVGVRNVASWAGNMMLAKNHPEFPSDLVTVFAGLGASLTLTSSAGTRDIAVADLPTTQFAQDEFLLQLHVPITPPTLVFDSYKVRARHQNAHPIVNAAYHFLYASQRSPAGNLVIQSSQLIVGGLTLQGIFQARQTMAYLQGKELTAQTMAGAIAQLDAEALPGERSDPTSTFYIADPAYRHSLVLATFYKFFVAQLAASGNVTVPASDESAFSLFTRPVSGGSEVYQEAYTPPEAPVGKAIPKVESAMQATGEATYIDDLALPPNGLWAAYFYSQVATGTLATIDASAAMAMPGVVRVLTAADLAKLPGAANDCGSFPGDEEIFASTRVTATGQALGMVLAETRAQAEAAAERVVVTYATNPPPPAPIVTIQDAIAAKSFFPGNQYLPHPPPVTCGDFATAYANAPNKLQGTNTGLGQTHFFMETQTCYAVPAENDGLYVYSSSQGPTDIRGMVTRVTGLPAHKVTVQTRRTGGGFGGKLSRSHPIACAVALAARIMRRPIKAQTSRTTDMDMFGKRPEMYTEFQVGFDNNGKVLALNTTFYQHGGHTYEANFGSLSMCLTWSDNAYYIPNFTATGVVCQTNTPSNTAMRAPGAFFSIWHIEQVMEAIAAKLGMSPDAVRANNFYTEGQLTPYQQPVTNITMPRVWQTLQTQANYAAQKTAVAQWNAQNKWRKRGVHCTAVKYGITDPGNQIGILLNVMQDDGTLVVSHTGVELGQGINTKVAQTIAFRLGIDMSLIIIDENATNIVCNGSQTGGSATSESACAAAILACDDLNNRLAPFKTANPGAAWPALIAAAAAGVNAQGQPIPAGPANLIVSAQYNLPAPAMPFTYYVWAASCSVCELDVLTGEVQVLQTDIVYDCGNSLNPAVDIGQIEGAFMTGLGHYLCEGVVYDGKSGRLLTRGTWDYHPPSSQDIPLTLNVTLLNNAANPASGSILSSKATAEPPMMLSGSVFLAVKDCIAAARADQGLTGWFDLPAPASTQAVQLACGIKPATLVL